MQKLIVLLISILSLCFHTKNFAQAKDKLIAAASTVKIYKSIDGIDLKAYIFNPPNHQKSDERPAIIFFFGGGWKNGTPAQFIKHCEYLAARGMVAITADYRVFDRHGVQVNECVSDAKSAIRWMRQQADSLGINPNKIIGAGGSSGGHLAASAAIIDGFDASQDDLKISPIPNALVLFNPPLVLAALPEIGFSEVALGQLRKRMGTEPILISPYHHVKSGICPTIIFHGSQDTKVFLMFSEAFCKVMTENGNNCQLLIYEGERHAFFNYGRKDNGPFIDTVKRIDDFLVNLGYLTTVPIVRAY